MAILYVIYCFELLFLFPTVSAILLLKANEIIANILINEISIIINCIAPAKKVQCNTKYAPWINDDFIIQSKLRDNLHNKAKKSDSQKTGDSTDLSVTL